MSLLAITDTTLCIADDVTLKRTTLNTTKIRLKFRPRAITWSSDNSLFFAASADTIYSFSSTSPSSVGTAVYVAPKGQALQPVLLFRDTSTLIFAQNSNIHVLALSKRPKIPNTLIGHSSPIISLSLSNDGTLLASASLSGTLCVHNLTQNSLTVLKGLASITNSISKKLICAFHSHSRTRLLVGCGRTFAIYDVTRPSNPMKTIKFSEIPANSSIISIMSSPFSKPLLAVAFNSGLVALVDLDKDRSLLKVLDVNMPITTMDFTSDGTAVALGTESGKIIVKGWRSVEEGDQMIALDDHENEERIIALSIQRRIKHLKLPAESNATPSISSSKLSHPLVELRNAEVPSRHVDIASPAEFYSQSSRMNWTKTASTPLYEAPKTDDTSKSDVGSHRRTSSTENKAPSVQIEPISFHPTQTRITALATVSSSSIEHVAPPISSGPDGRSSHLDVPRRMKKTSGDSLKARDVYQPTSIINSVSNYRTTSPKLEPPEIASESNKVTSQRQTCKIGRDRMTLPTNKKEKQVGWIPSRNGTHSKQSSIVMELSHGDSDETPAGPGEPTLGPIESPHSNNSEVSLHTLMQMMHEHRRELREDVKGLHVDVLRMGRVWKNELRLLMDQHACDLKALAAENAQLRKENNILKQRL